MKDLKKRVITAVILVACLIPIVFFGGLVIDIACGVLAVLAAWELEHMYKGDNPWTAFSICQITLTGIVYTSLLLIFYFHAYVFLFVLIGFVFLIEGFFMIFMKSSSIDTLGRSLLTIFYPGIGFASLSILRNMSTGLYREGLFVLLFVILICFNTDNFAYVFGSKYGKHQLSLISPHKTWEGSIAGTVFAAVIPPIFAYFTGVTAFIFPDISLGWAVVLSVLFSIYLSLVDEIGDLFASKLKRHFNFKDYSEIFPGHGGVLDRFDSYIFVGVALLVYLLII